jgi:HEAT repeat protein
MSFYDLPKEEREVLVTKMETDITRNLENEEYGNIYKYSSDSDTYIRKNAYLALYRIYQNHEDLRDVILHLLDEMIKMENAKIRQTAVYALGELGKIDADRILNIFKKALEDENSSVRNAVIGSLKQMGLKNPEPTLKFVQKNLHHSNPEVRREMVHGIELRGRTHPKEVIPFLEELQNEENKRVRKTIIHVLGQISYKKGCLDKVITALKNWENQKIVDETLKEIIEVHKRYKFASKSPQEAEDYINANF